MNRMVYRISTVCVILAALAVSAAIGAEWGLLSIQLGKENISNGIVEKSQADGVTEPDKIGGKECRFVPKTPPGMNTGNHIYFSVDTAVIPDKSKTNELWIAVEFYDSAKAATGLIMDWDDKGDVYPQQAFALNAPADLKRIPFEYTNEWRIAIKHITDAEFKDQGNGADFRFHIDPYMSEGFYVHKVWVSDHELTLEELTGVGQAVSPGEKTATFWAKVKKGE
jgi:hypothetical protein